jgi:hypothetical protein
MIGKHVVVTTEHRGVFAGTLESLEDKMVVLTGVRMCVYWSPETRGVTGLAGCHLRDLSGYGSGDGSGYGES